jgi:hypothetical protein
VLAAPTAGCERGCGWRWLREHGIEPSSSRAEPGFPALSGMDCPDGLARCIQGEVEVSRLAKVVCRGPETPCDCPWEPLASCPQGCVADGLELVIDRAQAATQLCRPEEAMTTFASDAARAEAAGCQEEELYRCADSAIIDCRAHSVIARCARGCFAEGAAIAEEASGPPRGQREDGTFPPTRTGQHSDGESSMQREAAFAILCSR